MVAFLYQNPKDFQTDHHVPPLQKSEYLQASHREWVLHGRQAIHNTQHFR